MRKVLCILLICIIIFSLIGCSAEESVVAVNVKDSESLASTHFGEFISISEKLSYDSATRIVYLNNYTYGGRCVHTAYFAPNGIPYRYNPETNTFEEIER